jgi:ribose transport system substrate-binding protein
MDDPTHGLEEALLESQFSRLSLFKRAGVAGLAIGGSGALLGALRTSDASALGVLEEASIVPTLPKLVQQYYELATTTPLGQSVFHAWKPKAGPPWKLGFSSSFAGNTWRIGARTRLQTVMLPTYKKAGLVSDVITTESNLVMATQIQQIRQLVDQGVHAIFTIGAAPTALNGAIKYAYDHGVLFVAIQGGVTSPYALQVSGNYALAGKMQGQSLGESMDGKGNVLVVQGITQATASADFERGHHIGLSKYPDIHIIGTVAGSWVDAQAKTQVLQFLATHPQPLGGVASQSPGDLGVLSALQQTGRKIVPITAGGELGPLAYWRDNPTWIKEMYQSWPPGDEMQYGFEAMMRTLEGQGPKIASILIGPGPTTYQQVVKMLPKGTNYTNNQWLEPPAHEWFPPTTMDMFFNKPHDPLTWKKS